ncbi:MAG TPA: hypothetical protein VJJ55_01045 [Candidatus Paceibacterota bacterium]
MKIYTKSVAVSIENGINNDSEIGGSSYSSVAMLVDSPLSGKPEWTEFHLPWSRKGIENLAAEVTKRDQYDNRVWLLAGSACKKVCGPIESVDAESGTIVVGQPCHHQFVKYPTCNGWEQPDWKGYTMCLVDGAYKSICDGSADVAFCVEFDGNALVESTLFEGKETRGFEGGCSAIFPSTGSWSEYEALRVVRDYGSFSAYAESILSVNPGRTTEDLLSGDLLR